MAYLDLYDFRDTDARDEDYLEIASAIVQELAPVPEPEPDDYAPKARAAERLVFNWISSTSGGSLTSKSIAGTISFSFSDQKVVRRMVKGVMGDYYTGGTSGLRVVGIERG